MNASTLHKLKRHQANCHTVFKIGGVRPAVQYLRAAVTGSQSPVLAGGMLIRPNTPDAIVVSAMRKGEFTEPIRAATPLLHNFILDCGGYIGTAAIAFARAFPDATIVSVEPSPDNFALLTKNVSPYPNIVPVLAAVAAEAGTANLSQRATGQWGWSIVVSGDGRRCEAVAIPDLMRQFGASGIDVLKLDIEGAERDVLLHSSQWIRSTRVLFVELHDRIIPGCSDAFANACKGRQLIACSREKLMSVVAVNP